MENEVFKILTPEEAKEYNEKIAEYVADLKISSINERAVNHLERFAMNWRMLEEKEQRETLKFLVDQYDDIGWITDDHKLLVDASEL
jgi:hypothetical protein